MLLKSKSWKRGRRFQQKKVETEEPQEWEDLLASYDDDMGWRQGAPSPIVEEAWRISRSRSRGDELRTWWLDRKSSPEYAAMRDQRYCLANNATRVLRATRGRCDAGLPPGSGRGLWGDGVGEDDAVTSLLVGRGFMRGWGKGGSHQDCRDATATSSGDVRRYQSSPGVRRGRNRWSCWLSYKARAALFVSDQDLILHGWGTAKMFARRHVYPFGWGRRRGLREEGGIWSWMRFMRELRFGLTAAALRRTVAAQHRRESEKLSLVLMSATLGAALPRST